MVFLLFYVYLFFVQSFMHIFSEKGIEHGYQRDEYQHAHYTKQAAAQRDRRQNPDGRKANGAADHFGVDQIPFDLLQNKEHDDKEQCLFRVDRQNQECTHTAADECPENGDEGCEGDEYPDQRAKGKRKMVIAMKNIRPRMTASVHCPVRKFVKVL